MTASQRREERVRTEFDLRAYTLNRLPARSFPTLSDFSMTGLVALAKDAPVADSLPSFVQRRKLGDTYYFAAC